MKPNENIVRNRVYDLQGVIPIEQVTSAQNGPSESNDKHKRKNQSADTIRKHSDSRVEKSETKKKAKKKKLAKFKTWLKKGTIRLLKLSEPDTEDDKNQS